MKNIILFLLPFLMGACCVNKNHSAKNVDLLFAFPDIVIYKTTKDYTNNVPIIMNAERTRVVRYPAPTDLRRGDRYATPILLDNGYLLDCYGITQNVVFLDYTFEQYANLLQAPALDEMMMHIIDKNPLVELWNCGKSSQYKTLEDINVIVQSNFRDCLKLNK